MTATVAQIPLAVPRLGGNEARYVAECLETEMVSSIGPFVSRFEEAFAGYVGARHAVACASGTAALHVALRLAGATSGGVVPVSDFTFIASANAIRYCGAEPLLVDSEPETWNMDTERLYDEIVARARVGRTPPAAIEIVHVLGHPARMEPLLELRARYGIPIVEDAAEALGATWRTGELAGRHVGTVGDVGCFSFNGNKVMTTGGGGMIVTNDTALAERARHLTTQARLPGAGYVHDDVGYNYRLSNLAAAVGLAQLEQLPDFLAAKRRIAGRYAELLANLPLTLPPHAPWAEPSWWLYSLLVHPDAEASPTQIVRRLADDGIQARPVWQPLHSQRPYRSALRFGGAVADLISSRGLSLPCSASLTDPEQGRVIDAMAVILTGQSTTAHVGESQP